MGEEGKSIEDLIRQLGADDVEERERAEQELRRRLISDDPGLLKRLREAQEHYGEADTADYDAEIVARLNELLTACRYFIRVVELVIVSLDGTRWKATDVQTHFGDQPNAFRVTTPGQDLAASLNGEIFIFDPHDELGLPPLPIEDQGLQIFNSLDDAHETHMCGDPVTHTLFIKVGDYGEGSETIRFRCLTGHVPRVVVIPGHFGLLRHPLEFRFKINIISKCFTREK